MSKPKPKDRRLHNTRILLHALGGGLRMHITKSVMCAADLEGLELMPLLLNRDPEVLATSIARSKTRSEIHLVNAERLYAAWVHSSRSGAHRQRCRIVRAWYFQKMELAEIAYNLKRTEGTILVQLGIVLDELGGREYVLSEVLATFRELYDYILIDCKPSLDVLTINALAAADSVIVTTNAAKDSINSVETLLTLTKHIVQRKS